MDADLSTAISEIIQHGFGTIDMTARHGLPNRQGGLFKSVSVDDPIVDGIVRDGEVLQLGNCDDCGTPISALPTEKHPLCGDCFPIEE